MPAWYCIYGTTRFGSIKIRRVSENTVKTVQWLVCGRLRYDSKRAYVVACFHSITMAGWFFSVNNGDKRHVRSKNHSSCLETSCHVRGPLRNKMATLGVIPSRSDSDPSIPSADPVPGQTTLPIVSLTESDMPGAFSNGWL